MEISTNGAEAFKELGVKFRAAGKDGAAMRRELTKTIQGHLKRIVDEQRTAAAGMNIKGARSTGGTRRRQAYHEASALRGRTVRARRGGYGLRASVARGIKSRVSYTGRKLGARISATADGMPPSQRKLPRHLDNPRGWRHPVFGGDEWVTQYGEPYFSKPIQRHRVQVRRDVTAAVDKVMRTLK